MSETSNVLSIRPLKVHDPQESLLVEMLDGWSKQQLARNLAQATIVGRERLIRRFVSDMNEYPWNWTSPMLDEWLGDRRSICNWRRSTVRASTVTIRLFCDFLCDPAYDWVRQTEEQFGTHPTQICHRWNTAVHAQAAEGSPWVRPFTEGELQDFFDCADDRVAQAHRLGRKGWWTSFRDATMFKVAFAYGLRRREVRLLDVGDFRINPHAPEFGDYGVLAVRFGKGSRGSPPRPRSTLTVFEWTVDCVQEWVEEIRPLQSNQESRYLWPSERNHVLSESRINQHFSSIRSEIGLDSRVTFHSFRRSYVTMLIEKGFDAKFVQDQVGHQHASTTALYTSVSSDFRVKALRRALDIATTDLSNLTTQELNNE